MMTFSKRTAAAALAALLVATGSARAAFVLPAWTRGSPDTTYQAWDLFVSPGGVNAPNSPNPPFVNVDAAPFNPFGAANVTEATAGTLITSGGNIYNPTGTIAVAVTVPNAGLGASYSTQILLQFRTLGNELDFSTLTVGGSLASTLDGYAKTELFREAYAAGGDRVDTAIAFNVAGNASLYTFNISAAGTSTSFDRLSVDTAAVTAGAPVPEPVSLSLLGLGVLGLLCRRSGSRTRRSLSSGQ